MYFRNLICLIAIDNYLGIYQNSEKSTYLFNII